MGAEALVQEDIKASWSGDVEREDEGTHKCCVQYRLWHPVRVKGWRHNRGKGITRGLMSRAYRPRYLGHREADGMEGLEKPTLGGHGVHAELLAQGHHGHLQQCLVQPWEKFWPVLPTSLLFDAYRGSICSETVLSSTLHKTDSNKISSGNMLCICYFQWV